MDFNILVEPSNGSWSASVIGAPNLAVKELTKEGAISSLRRHITKRMQAGEILTLRIENLGVTGLAGLFADDPTLDEIVEEAYRLRDEELAELDE